MIRTAFKLAALAVFALSAAHAAAQTLPTMKFVSAPLVSPATALASYGEATAHSSSFTGVSGFEGRPPEIVEMARTLKGDPDLIFEYVRNQVATELAFGSRKGALGALIDQSGTPFDQNQLFVELVRQAGYQARYKIGRATFTGAAFASWRKLSEIGQACRTLASAGIPAAFNGAASSPADCSLTGTINSVTLLHVWSEVNIGGTWYAFDPSFKTLSPVSGRNLASDAGLTAGAVAAQAASGMTSSTAGGAPFIQSVNAAQIDTYLQARGAQLATTLKSAAPATDLEAVVGFGTIQQVYKPAGGWRSTSPVDYSAVADRTITGDLPDQYRAKLRVTVNAQSTTALDRQLYGDEVYGRRLAIDSNFDKDHIQVPTDYCHQQIWLSVDDVALQTYTLDRPTAPQGACGPSIFGTITLTADHPYVAASGAYADQTITRDSDFTVPVAIVAGWGQVSPRLAAKWSSERADDKSLPIRLSANSNGCDPSYMCVPEFETAAGDITRQGVAASWLAQFSRMFALQNALGGTVGQHHHTLGVVHWIHDMNPIQTVPTDPNHPWDFAITDQYLQVNLDTVLSVSASTANAAKVNAVARATAAAAATLEGSVLEQTQDLPDTASTASRLAWAQRPDNEDPCNAGARRIFDFSGTTASVRSGLLQYEGSANGCNAGPSVPSAGANGWKYGLEYAIAGYASAGFQITAAAESFMGPGARFGPPAEAVCATLEPRYCSRDYKPSRQRGGAVIATRYDASGNVADVAHALTGIFGVTKGGGGKQPERQATFDPKRAADVLKDRFVDRSSALGVDLRTGQVGYSTPTLLSAGAGDTPYRLDFGLSYKNAPTGCSPQFGPCASPPQGGWTNNWDIRFSLSGSGLEAMGATSPFSASGSLVAFMAMQDVFGQAGLSNLQKDAYAALIADWWRRQMVANVATVTQGFQARQYVRQADSSWQAPIGSPGVLTQTGTRAKVRDTCFSSWNGVDPIIATARRWNQSGVSFSLRNAQGDVMSFAPFSANYSSAADNCAILYGFKATSWTWPQGVSLTFNHTSYGEVGKVTTSLGRTMDVSLSATSSGYSAGRIDAPKDATKDAAGAVWTFDYVPPQARSATQRPTPFAKLAHVYEPVAPGKPALEYAYDSLGRVKQASDATALQWKTRGAYTFLPGEGGRGERIDPNGGAYVVYWDAKGDPVRHIDEIGRLTASTYDGRHRVTGRIFPEGDQTAFAYDAKDNVLSLTQTAKPGLGSPYPTRTVSATWHPTWNKLTSLTDPAGRTTDLEYYDTGSSAGLLRYARRPAPTAGGQRPVYAYEYDGRGLLNKEYDATGRVTTYVNDALGNRTSMTRGVAAVGSAALNLTTTYTPNVLGDIVAAVDPRGNATTWIYDAMRRRTDEVSRDGGVTAQPLMAKHWIYDANGRVTAEQRAAAFNGSTVTAWKTRSTSYTPTGQTAQNTDPAGLTSRTIFDALDRPLRVIDAAGQVTQNVYDLAGQLTQVRRGVGTPSEQAFETYGYTLNGQRAWIRDARNNQTGFAYDGYDRLARITFPDASYEENTYDLAGNVITWRNRGGYQIQRAYDRLDRKTTEQGLTGGVPNQNQRSWDMYDRSFGYDLNGRMTTAANAQMTHTWSFDAAGRPTSRGSSWPVSYVWDKADNLTSVFYPDGTQVNYAYDALNRMTIASYGSGNAVLSGLYYDALGRRIRTNFADGSNQVFTYDDSDRVTSIAHAFATPADNVTIGYGYDPAGRETSRTLSNPAYAYSPLVQTLTPTAGTTTYGAANALNQYPTVGGMPLTWWPEGPARVDSAHELFFDEENRLKIAYPLQAGGGTNPDIWTRYHIDPLGHTYVRANQSGAGAVQQHTYFSTDGLRPETVLEWQYDAPPGQGSVLKGQRRYVLGPNPDERLVMIDADGVGRYPHTDRLGTTIAVSGGGAPVLKLRYSPWGESAEPVAVDAPGASSYAYRYTGQRLDPWSGLYNYKARDYFPALGRFVQPDPLGFHEDGPNLYAYVLNDPVNGTDPTGAEVRYVYGPLTANEAKRAYNYLSGSATYRSMIDRLSASKEVYTIRSLYGATDHYDTKTRTVTWNPSDALVTKGGNIQSPAIGAGHEISHADYHNSVGTAAYNQAGKAHTSVDVASDGTIMITPGVAPREARATGVENQIAREVGDVGRKNYRDVSGGVTALTSTTHSCLSALKQGGCSD